MRLEQQRQLEIQVACQKEALKNKRDHKLSIARGQRDDSKGKGAIIEAPEPYDLNLSNAEEGSADLKSTDCRSMVAHWICDWLWVLID